MASWKCIICNWENAEKWEKCAKCGTIRIPGATNSDGELFRQLSDEVKILKSEIEKYKINYAKKWEYLQISSDDLQNVGGLGNLGAKGWELVSVTSYSEGGGVVFDGVGSSRYTVKLMYVFKRPMFEIPGDLVNKFQNILNRTPTHLRNALRDIANF